MRRRADNEDSDVWRDGG
jgi:hypothetical protein